MSIVQNFIGTQAIKKKQLKNKIVNICIMIGFWNSWKDNTVKRDYEFLDKIHPNRIRSAEEWMR
jgi:hypothetical protein